MEEKNSKLLQETLSKIPPELWKKIGPNEDSYTRGANLKDLLKIVVKIIDSLKTSEEVRYFCVNVESRIRKSKMPLELWKKILYKTQLKRFGELRKKKR